jgi:hypothetical protein
VEGHLFVYRVFDVVDLHGRRVAELRVIARVQAMRVAIDRLLDLLEQRLDGRDSLAVLVSDRRSVVHVDRSGHRSRANVDPQSTDRFTPAEAKPLELEHVVLDSGFFPPR